MKSKASVKGHPLHPMLIPYPFAFLTGAAAFDYAGVVLGRRDWWTTARHLARAGIGSALVAAIPGIVDYFYTVPPRSSGRRRATYHALSNLTALALFGIAQGRRRRDDRPDVPAVLLETAATALMSVAGYMGGTLVYRNQIGVDIRYAGAGKWQESEIEPADRMAVATEDELQENQMKLLWIDGRRFVLARTARGYAVFDDGCTHRGGSLAGGALICDTVQCPWHGSHFDVHTGAVKEGPAREPIGSYPTSVADGRVYVSGINRPLASRTALDRA